MDVWLKSGFLIPCIRLMWLSRREGRGKLGLSSAQYLREHSPKTGSKVTGPREPGGATHTGKGARRTLPLASGERAGWGSSGWPGSAGHSPETQSRRAGQGGGQQQVRMLVPALSHDLSPLPAITAQRSQGWAAGQQGGGQMGHMVPSPSLLLRLRGGHADWQCCLG